MGNRTRNYATVVYPESAPAHWLSILEESHVPACVSPLHDSDVNPDGEKKKEHYHVVIMFDSVKTPEQAKEVFDSIGGVGCEAVKSIRGYIRYLCHLDNPEKFHYDIDKVTSLNGADYIDLCSLPSDKYAIICEMTTYIRNNHIKSFSRFMDYCASNQPDWFRSLCDNCAYIIMEYIKANNWVERCESQGDFFDE